MTTDVPDIIFIVFIFSCEAGDLRFSLKLDNIKTEFDHVRAYLSLNLMKSFRLMVQGPRIGNTRWEICIPADRVEESRMDTRGV